MEILDFSALSFVLVTKTGLQMQELEIQKQTELEKLRLEQERQMQKEKMEMEERVQKERMEMEEREKEKMNIIGKAREFYTQLTVEQSSSYGTVEELILKAYELVSEAYRQNFRNCKKENEQTHVARTKEQLFDRWCSSKKLGSHHEKLEKKILRDTRASQSLILADILPFSEKPSSGTNVLIQGVECGFVNVPLHNIYLC